ncbi:MAG: aromatic-ring-hydroxylating dioxygenase subunit beta [Acidimicrobiaceae bacterium]|nr:aromatic-ring-hydroxylating dioxygenase subunit beta [Acidimicrobiaceae bacterium]
MTPTELPADLATLLSVQAFIYREARLLDDGLLEEWLSLFAEDGEYILPIKDGPPPEPAIIRDSHARIEERVYRLSSTLAHSQRPRSRTQHEITNIELLETNQPNEVLVACNQTVHELRPGNPFQVGLADPRSLHARCRYRLKANDGSWLIREKCCFLINREYPIYNLTFIF